MTVKFIITISLLVIECTNAVTIDGKQMSMDEAIMNASNSTEMSDMVMDDDGNTVKVEMDMLYPIETYLEIEKDMEEEEREEGTRIKRKAKRSHLYRWPEATVPYEMSSRLPKETRKVIKEAIADYHKYTCLKLRPARSTDQYRVRFLGNGGCSSYVGMIRNSKNQPQSISLSPGCETKGIVIHEIGHAIGFHHEQTRPDRDNYVKIIKRNVEPNRYFNFRKHSSTDQNMYNVPYDYSSVMHYSQRAFSANRKRTIVTNDKTYQDEIGNREGLSFRDIQLANTMYDCAAMRNCPKVSCPKNSFQGPDCKCWCDSGNKASPVKECGKTVVTTEVTTEKPSVKCEDKRRSCEGWKNAGYCRGQYADYMKDNCAASCNLCKSTKTTKPSPAKNCRDSNQYCASWAKRGECDRNPSYMLNFCKQSCDQCNSAARKLDPNPDADYSTIRTADILMLSTEA